SYSLLELIFSTSTIVMVGALAVPGVLASIDDQRAYGAARYVSSRVQRARMEAVARSASVALRFVNTPEGYAFGAYVDGNRNGVRTSEIQRGIDRELMPLEHLTWLFVGVDFGVLPGLPPVDPASPPLGTDPSKL